MSTTILYTIAAFIFFAAYLLTWEPHHFVIFWVLLATTTIHRRLDRAGFSE